MGLAPLRPQVDPQGTARLSEAGAAGFTGLGQGLQQVGEAAERLDLARRQAARNEEVAAKAVELEQLKAGIEADELAAREGQGGSAAPGWAGHAEALTRSWDERSTAFLGGIRDERVRREFTAQVAAYRGNLASRAGAFEAGKRVDAMARNVDQAGDLIANRVGRTPTIGELGTALADAEDDLTAQIAALDVAPDIKERLLHDQAGKAQRAALERMTDLDPAAARAAIDRGVFDRLPPELLDAQRREIGVEERRQAVEAEAAARLEKAEAKDRIDLFVRESRDGVPHSRAQVAEIAGLIERHGFAGEGYDVAELVTGEDVRREVRAATPQQIAASLAEVRGRIARAGDGAKREDVWRAAALEAELGKRRQQVESDPYAFAAANGRPPAPLNLSDPASIDARLRLRGQVQGATGRPAPVFTPDEAAELSAQLVDTKGRARVAGQLAALPGPAKLEAARQLAPRDFGFQQATQYPAGMRARIFAGEEALRGNQQLAPPAEVNRRFQERAAKALARVPGGFREGVRAVAMRLYAADAARGAGEWDDDAFDRAIDLALDPSGKGGIGRWRGQPVLLPGATGQRDFEARIAAIGRVNGFVHADGTPIDAAELKRRYTPVAGPVPGHYWFVDDRGGFALRPDRKTPAAADLSGGAR